MGDQGWLREHEDKQEETEERVMAARLRQVGIDELSNLISEVDGNHDLSAGALAVMLYDRGVRVTS